MAADEGRHFNGYSHLWSTKRPLIISIELVQLLPSQNTWTKLSFSTKLKCQTSPLRRLKFEWPVLRLNSGRESIKFNPHPTTICCEFLQRLWTSILPLSSASMTASSDVAILSPSFQLCVSCVKKKLYFLIYIFFVPLIESTLFHQNKLLSPQ